MNVSAFHAFHRTIFDNQAPVVKAGTVYGELRLAGIGSPGKFRVIHLISAAPGPTMSTANQNRGSEDMGASVLDTNCDSKPVFAHACNKDCKDRWRVERICMSISTISCLCNVFQQLESTSARMLISFMPKPVHNEPTVLQQMPISSDGVFKPLFIAATLNTLKEFSSSAE